MPMPLAEVKPSGKGRISLADKKLKFEPAWAAPRVRRTSEATNQGLPQARSRGRLRGQRLTFEGGSSSALQHRPGGVQAARHLLHVKHQLQRGGDGEVQGNAFVSSLDVVSVLSIVVGRARNVSVSFAQL